MGARTSTSRDDPREVLGAFSTVLEDGTIVSVRATLDPGDPLAGTETVTLLVEVWNLATRGRQALTVTPAIAIALVMRLREALGALGRGNEGGTP